MTSQKNMTDDLLIQRELLQSFPQLTSTLVDIRQDIFNTLKAKAGEIYDSPQRTAMDTLAADEIVHAISPGYTTIDNDRGREKVISQKEDRGSGFFRIDLGMASSRYGDLLHTIDPSINVGDRICRLHVEPITSSNNPRNRSVKEMYEAGYKRIQDTLRALPELERPQFIISCSHLSSNFAKRYPYLFYNFPLSLELQYQTSPYKYIFSESAKQELPEVIKKFESEIQTLSASNPHDPSLPRRQDRLDKNKGYLKMSGPDSKYDGTISIAIAKVEDFLNYDFG